MEKTRGEEMLEAYRAQKIGTQRSHSSSSSSPDGLPRSRIPVRGPPPNYQTALRSSRHQELGLGPESLQVWRGRGGHNVISVQCATPHHNTAQ